MHILLENLLGVIFNGYKKMLFRIASAESGRIIRVGKNEQTDKYKQRTRYEDGRKISVRSKYSCTRNG